MLVLSRKKNETIKIIVPADAVPGDVLSLTVVEIRGDKVRLGFNIDGKYRIWRSEVLEKIESEECCESR